MIRNQQIRVWHRPDASSFFTRINSLIAPMSLLAIVMAMVLLWPLENLGYDSDSDTHKIVYVEPGSAAEKAGLRIGDQIVTLYNRKIEEVSASINVISFIGSQPVPIQVIRDGQMIAAKVERRQPTLSFQVSKLAMSFLAFICWSTGYLLGVARRHVVMGSPLVATYWLCMATVAGTITFASYAAYPLYTALVWFIIAFLAPLGFYIHLLYPPRLQQTSLSSRRVGVALFSASMLLSGVLGIWAFGQGVSILEFERTLVSIAPIAVVVSLGASGLLLYRAYRTTMLAHVRRQIRLIMNACLAVMLVWLLMLAVSVLLQSDYIIYGHWLPVLVGAVPLAYLVGGRVNNLYRLDRVVMRTLVHLMSATGLSLCLAASRQLFNLSSGPVILILFVVLYRPTMLVVLEMLSLSNRQQGYRALEAATQRLATTLETPLVMKTLIEGVQAQFNQPAVAFFLGDVAGANALTLEFHDRMTDMPEHIDAGPLTRLLLQTSGAIESRIVQERIDPSSLSLDEQRMILHPTVAIWGLVRHPQGHILGLLLLGMRPDLDPYHSVDIHALDRLLIEASLAFAHSTEYAQKVEAESEIRQLYQEIQEAQDKAAKELARIIHDEVINVIALMNIISLKKIYKEIPDGPTAELVASTLEREKELMYQLRQICDNLHPLGIDDPLGLPVVLRMEVDRRGKMWNGQCTFEMKGAPIPLEPRTQYEVFRITKEAISNSIKHAEATEIIVSLCYPNEIDGIVHLTITDNGRAARGVTAQGFQRGLRYMYESARTVHGTLDIHVEPLRSTTVKLSFPTQCPGTV